MHQTQIQSFFVKQQSFLTWWQFYKLLKQFFQHHIFKIIVEKIVAFSSHLQQLKRIQPKILKVIFFIGLCYCFAAQISGFVRLWCIENRCKNISAQNNTFIEWGQWLRFLTSSRRPKIYYLNYLRTHLIFFANIMMCTVGGAIFGRNFKISLAIFRSLPCNSFVTCF